MLLAFGENLLPSASLIIGPVGYSVKEQIICENERHKIEEHNLISTASQAPNLALDLTLRVKEEYSSSQT